MECPCHPYIVYQRSDTGHIWNKLIMQQLPELQQRKRYNKYQNGTVQNQSVYAAISTVYAAISTVYVAISTVYASISTVYAAISTVYVAISTVIRVGLAI